MGYIRFVRPTRLKNDGSREGIFVAAYELERSPLLGSVELAEAKILLNWFRENLAVPESFNSSTSKGAWRRQSKGLSWFKDDADETIAKAFNLVALLERHGCRIDVIRCSRVGRIVFEDAHQVVAEPFGDTPR